MVNVGIADLNVVKYPDVLALAPALASAFMTTRRKLREWLT